MADHDAQHAEAAAAWAKLTRPLGSKVTVTMPEVSDVSALLSAESVALNTFMNAEWVAGTFADVHYGDEVVVYCRVANAARVTTANVTVWGGGATADWTVVNVAAEAAVSTTTSVKFGAVVERHVDARELDRLLDMEVLLREQAEALSEDDLQKAALKESANETLMHRIEVSETKRVLIPETVRKERMELLAFDGWRC